MRVVTIIFGLLLILGGIIAMSGLIVAKKPDAQRILDRLVPFQAFIGVGMLVLGLVYWFYVCGVVGIFRGISADALAAVTRLVAVFGGIVLGMLFGMPQIAKWIPGDSPAEQKAMELSQKVAPFQALIGIGVAGAGVLTLLYGIGVLGAITRVTGLTSGS
jgi:hypothetical protein